MPVDVDGFGEWDLSDPGVSGFIIKKRVSGLVGGYSYRAAVRFRWRSDAGKIVRTAKKVTPACTQPDTTPDLAVFEPSIVAGARDDVVVYRAVVKNVGPAAPRTFDVVLAVNGVAQPPQRVGPLAPGATVAHQLPGAALPDRHDRPLHRGREGRDPRVVRDEQRPRAALRPGEGLGRVPLALRRP